MAMLGGMIPPMVPLTAVIAAAKLALYPARFMAGINSEPTVAVSATTEPFMPAKNMLTRMLTLREPALNPAHQPPAELDQPIGDGGAGHQLSGEHEERDRGSAAGC